jgi:hypothetical protein
MPDVMEKADLFEELAILVRRPDEAQGFLRSERKADLVGDVMVRLGDVGD